MNPYESPKTQDDRPSAETTPQTPSKTDLPISSLFQDSGYETAGIILGMVFPIGVTVVACIAAWTNPSLLERWQIPSPLPNIMSFGESGPELSVRNLSFWFLLFGIPVAALANYCRDSKWASRLWKIIGVLLGATVIVGCIISRVLIGLIYYFATEI